MAVTLVFSNKAAAFVMYKLLIKRHNWQSHLADCEKSDKKAVGPWPIVEPSNVLVLVSVDSDISGKTTKCTQDAKQICF